MSGIISIVGGPGTVSMASGGKVSPFDDIISTPHLVVQPNTNRRRLTFHNPGTVDVYVQPLLMANALTGALAAILLDPSRLGGSFLVVANGGTFVIEGECQGSWYAFTLSLTGSLTVMDSNI